MNKFDLLAHSILGYITVTWAVIKMLSTTMMKCLIQDHNKVTANDVDIQLLAVSQYWFRWWMACGWICWTGRQAITWTSAEQDLWCHSYEVTSPWVNSLRPRQNGRHFADDIFKCIFLNENVWISIKISLKFVPKGPINNIPALVQIMAWCRPGDKPLSEPMMVRTPTHICVTRPQWVNHWSICLPLGMLCYE